MHLRSSGVALTAYKNALMQNTSATGYTRDSTLVSNSRGYKTERTVCHNAKQFCDRNPPSGKGLGKNDTNKSEVVFDMWTPRKLQKEVGYHYLKGL